MQVKKLLSLTTTTIYCLVFMQVFLHNQASNKIFAETNRSKFIGQSSPINVIDYHLWENYLKDVSSRPPSNLRNILLIKLFSVRLHDILYDSATVDEQEQLLYDLVKRVRIQQPAVLSIDGSNFVPFTNKKGQWSKALRSGIKFSRTRLMRRSLPNLEYFLYHLNQASEDRRIL